MQPENAWQINAVFMLQELYRLCHHSDKDPVLKEL